MLKINISGHSYKLPTHWDEITLSQCVWLHNKVGGLPDHLRKYYLSYAQQETQEGTRDLLDFSSEVLVYLGLIPTNVMSRAKPEHILALSATVLPLFVCGVMGSVEYSFLGRKSFWHHGRRYCYPATGRDVMGIATPLSGLSAIELCQVSDIILSGNIALAPLAVVICCRLKREAYNEARAQRRADHFAQLPASIYWELWALVSAAHQCLKSNFPECYGKESSGETTTKGAVWCDSLVALAVGNPGTLTYLQQMNGYDFVHLLNESIKHKTEEWKMNAALSGLGVR